MTGSTSPNAGNGPSTSTENALSEATPNAQSDVINGTHPSPNTETIPPSDNDQQLHNEQVSADDFVVHIKFLRQNRLAIHCQPSIQISSLKNLILEEKAKQETDETNSQIASEETNAAPLRLIYKGKVLKDDQTLEFYDFMNGDTLHAVHGRPGTRGNASENSNASSQIESSGVAIHPTAGQETGPAGAARSNVPDSTVSYQHLGNGVMIGQIDFETNGNATAPELNAILNSMVSGIQQSDANGMERVVHANVGFHGNGEGMLNSILASMLSSEGISVAANAVQIRTSADRPENSNNTNDAPVNGSEEAANANASVGEGNASQNINSSDGTERVPENTGSSTPDTQPLSILEQATRIRRSLPPMELLPLSRPPDLPLDIYNLGIAIREASDTFLSIHRQLQFLAARFLHANYLTEAERNRLGYRIHSLIPSLREIRSLLAALTTALENTSYASQLPQQIPNNPGQTQTAQIRISNATDDINPLRMMSAFFSGIIGNAQAQPAQTPSENPNATSNTPDAPSNPQQHADSTREIGSNASGPDEAAFSLQKLVMDIILAISSEASEETDQISIERLSQLTNHALTEQCSRQDENIQNRFLEEGARELRAALISTQHHLLLGDGIILDLLQVILRHVLQLFRQNLSSADTAESFRQACQHFCGSLYWQILSSDTITCPSDAITITSTLISDTIYHLATCDSHSLPDRHALIRTYTEKLQERVRRYLQTQLN